MEPLGKALESEPLCELKGAAEEALSAGVMEMIRV